jgi:uncharacterized protein YjbJ (UPF0337 family)
VAAVGTGGAGAVNATLKGNSCSVPQVAEMLWLVLKTVFWACGLKSSATPQFWSDLRKSRDCKKVTALKEAQQSRNPSFTKGERRNMKSSTKDKIKGSFHEMKGTIKEEVGKITNDRSLKAEGKAEKKVGKVEHRIGHAKEAVAKLKGRLTDLKTG